MIRSSLFLLFLTSYLSGFSQSAINIIPKPESVVPGKGVYTYGKQTRIYCSIELTAVAQMLAETMKIPVNQVLVFKNGTTVTPGSVIIEKTTGQSTDSSAYRIEIKPSLVHVTSSGYTGALYAMQSITQQVMTGSPSYAIPCAVITDRPRFGYRGLMMDVSRHFYPPAFVRKMIDLIALYKLNTLHLHLTDAAGWRMEIKKYPLLTEQAAWRTAGQWKPWWKGDRGYAKAGEAGAYGGFYTQEDARELVSYAATRGITIIPEIEMPGHSEEVIAAFPHLGCLGAKAGQGEFCIGNDSTFVFMQDVLTEVMSIFPSQYIHIGGDEAGKKNWKACSRCQQRIKDNQLKDELELQSYAIRRMEKFISSKGRTLLGWDEILEGGLAPGATVMSWRGEKGGIDAANMGHDVIMTPGETCYFDKYQQDPTREPEAIGGFLPLQQVYQYEPIPSELHEDKHRFVKGAQANVWTEYIPTMEHFEYMVFPRIIALSEVTWSPKGAKDWTDFLSRLKQHYKILQQKHVNYCRPSDRVEISPVINTATRQTTITLSTEQFKPEIRYTIDGSVPSATSSVYTGPFTLSGSALLKTAVFRNGKMVQQPDTLDLRLHKALGKSVAYAKKWSGSYPAQKEQTLVNGYTGSLTYQDKQWQGFLTDIDVTIDLGSIQPLQQVSCRFMQVIGPGVYMPNYTEVFISSDGQNFLPAGRSNNDVSPLYDRLTFKSFSVDLKNSSARFVRFFAKNQRGFMFADEIMVE
jgi:hexosaminidase